jgi:catechol O-methyltransferase
MALKPTPAIIGFGVREGALSLYDRLTGKPSRPQRLLSYLREQTPAGDPVAALASMDRFAREQRFLMNVGDIKGRILVDALRRSGAGNVLELGTYCGYSAILMASHLQGNGHVDTLELNERYAATAREIIDHVGLSQRITVHLGAAADIIPTLKKQYELVFIDHWKDRYLADLKHIEEAALIRSGSVVVADNIGLFDASGYLDHVRDCGRYCNTNHEAHMEYNDTIFDAVEVSVMKP